MPLQPFQPLRSGSQLSAGELNRLAMETEAQDRVVASGAELARNAGGLQLLLRREVQFWAKITGNSGSGPTAHSWTEQLESSTGTFSDLTGGRTGTTSVFPAYSLDGGTIPTNRIVRLILGVGGDFYLVDPGAAASGGIMFSGARLHTTNDSTITDNTVTAITGYTEEFDVGGYYSTGAIFDIPATGFYLVGAHVYWPSVANMEVQTAITYSGGIIGVQVQDRTNATAHAIQQMISDLKSLPIGTDVTLAVTQISGASQTIGAGFAQFWIAKLGI